MKKIFSLVSAIFLLIGTIPAYAASTLSFTDSFVAVSTVTGTDSETAGGFSATVTAPVGSLQNFPAELSCGGEPSSKPLGVDALIVENEGLPAKADASQSYSIGSKLNMYEYYDEETISMSCLAIGKYCTVWGNADEGAVKMTTEAAEKVAAAFDEYQPLTEAAFGKAKDADNDGKLAIFCYDISHDYKNKLWGSYTAGYYYSGDISSRGIDCIHLDTYPGMSRYKNTFFTDVEGSFSTLVHEYQHLINYSVYRFENKAAYSSMETFLNEAFSMAAEHMICGAQELAGRISYFNNSAKYTPGWPLCCWGREVTDKDGKTVTETLPNYSSSYLFGQYLRTRYKQMNAADDNGNGDTLFRKVMLYRGSNTLDYLEELFGTTKQQLIQDFWRAVYLREASGNFGFAGEEWADAIQPQVTTLSAGSFTCNDIYNGGARYFDVPAGGTVTVTASENVVLLPLNTLDEGCYKATTTDSSMKVSMNMTEAGTLTVAFYDEDGKMLGCRQASVSKGARTASFGDAELAGLLASSRWRILAYDGDFDPLLLQNAAT